MRLVCCIFPLEIHPCFDCISICLMITNMHDLYNCFLAYISTSINDGPGCLMLRCPDPSCGAAVGQDMVDMLAPDEDKDKYRRYLLRSYIEDNRKVCTF